MYSERGYLKNGTSYRSSWERLDSVPPHILLCTGASIWLRRMWFSTTRYLLRSRSSSFTDSQTDSSRFFQFIPVSTPVMASCMNDQYRLKRGEIQAEKGHGVGRKLHENSTFQYFDPPAWREQSRPATRRALGNQCLYPEDADSTIPFLTGMFLPWLLRWRIPDG